MIPNPPCIITLLRSYAALVAYAGSTGSLPEMLAVLLKRHIGHQPYAVFLQTYQLYLQSIPLEAAKAAWGINNAETLAPVHQTK